MEVYVFGQVCVHVKHIGLDEDVKTVSQLTHPNCCEIKFVAFLQLYVTQVVSMVTV